MKLHQVPTLEEIAATPARVRDLPRHALVDLALRCATVQSALAIALAADVAAASPSKDLDELLTASAAAPLLGHSADWLNRHADEFPFTVRQDGHRPRFSKLGIQAYISQTAARQAAERGA